MDLLYFFMSFLVVVLILVIFNLRKSFFSFLILMEMFVSFISAFMVFSVMGGLNYFVFSVLITFLCFAVLEAVLGLSVLVSSSRCSFSHVTNSFSVVSF